MKIGKWTVFFFRYSEDGYVSIARWPAEDEKLELMKDDQVYSAAVLPSEIVYSLNRNELCLSLTDEIAEKIRTDKELILQFDVSDEIFCTMQKVTERIFSGLIYDSSKD